MSEELKKAITQLQDSVDSLQRENQNLVNRVKTAEKNNSDTSKDLKKTKQSLSGLRDAHNERVKEWIEVQGSLQMIAKQFGDLYGVVQGMRYALSAMVKKGLISHAEITAFTEDLMEQAKKVADETDTKSNETKESSEEGSIQPEGTGATESGSGSGDTPVVSGQSGDEA